MNKPPFIPIGDMVQPYGTVGAILITGGERYYMLTDADGVVSLMPGDHVEALWLGDEQEKKP